MRSVRLRTRLLVSFVAVAIAGVATLAILVMAILPARLSRLVVDRQDRAAARAAQILERDYERRGSWNDDPLRRAAAIAGEAGASIVELATDPAQGPALPSPPDGGPAGESPGGVGQTSRTPSGTGTPSPSSAGSGGSSGGRGQASASSSAGPTGSLGPSSAQSGSGGMGTGGSGAAAAGAGTTSVRTVDVPIVVDGRTVGTLTVRYPSEGLPGPERALERSLRWSVLAASTLAILAASAAAVVVARRIDRPISQLTRAARRLGRGDLAARAGSDGAPGEIGELAATFDQMAESLAREDEVRRVLVADVAHELRTPVTILQASLEELVDGSVEPDTDRLSSLHDEVLRLAKILQDLGSLAAAQAAGLEMTTQPVDLAKVAGNAVERLQSSFATAEIEPHTDLVPVIVEGDPDRLGQVVTNLLTNAMKFTPPGGDVRVTVVGMNGDARLEVTDSGPGISEDELPHVFERFWRGQAGRSTSGSGVGLAVVAELVRAHHGRVEVSSDPGSGASFRVILPRG